MGGGPGQAGDPGGAVAELAQQPPGLGGGDRLLAQGTDAGSGAAAGPLPGRKLLPAAPAGHPDGAAGSSAGRPPSGPRRPGSERRRRRGCGPRAGRGPRRAAPGRPGSASPPGRGDLDVRAVPPVPARVVRPAGGRVPSRITCASTAAVFTVPAGFRGRGHRDAGGLTDPERRGRTAAGVVAAQRAGTSRACRPLDRGRHRQPMTSRRSAGDGRGTAGPNRTDRPPRGGQAHGAPGRTGRPWSTTHPPGAPSVATAGIFPRPQHRVGNGPLRRARCPTHLIGTAVHAVHTLPTCSCSGWERPGRHSRIRWDSRHRESPDCAGSSNAPAACRQPFARRRATELRRVAERAAAALPDGTSGRGASPAGAAGSSSRSSAATDGWCQCPAGAREICCTRPARSGATHSSAILSPSMR
ncbi:hypothetical protein SUDANB6_00526 [Streptomyces sp. enrichment culture]